MLVDHHGDLRVAVLQHLQKARDRDALGHSLDPAHGQVVDGGVLRQHIQVLDVHEPYDAVLGFAAHGVARVLVAQRQRHVLFQRILEVDAHQVGARRHDGLGVLVAQIEDVVHERVLLGVDQAAFGRFVDEQLDLVAGVHLVLVGRIVAGQAHHRIGDTVEQHHDGIGDLVERHQRAGREQRVAFGGENGERLGNKLAHHHVQRRHDEVPDGDGDHFEQRLGQAQQNEQRADDGRERRLTQPAERERGERDAQLTRGKVLVDVLGDDHGALRAGLPLLHRQLKLRFAHAHERELGDDEKRVHQQEQDDEKQAYAKLHGKQGSFNWVSLHCASLRALRS